MVYPGHPSNACGTCKARRVKCDEARPYCDKCVYSKRTCLGYHSRSLPTQDRSHIAQRRQWSTRRLIPATPWSKTMLSSPYINDAVALRFAENFILIAQDPYSPGGFLQGLSTALYKPNNHDTLRVTFRVFAGSYYSLSQSYQTREKRRSLFHGYQTAIHGTRCALSSQRRSGTLIMTLYLLTLFEVRFKAHVCLMSLFVDNIKQMAINSEKVFYSWQMHLRGLLALLACPSSCTSSVDDTLSRNFSEEIDPDSRSNGASFARSVCSLLMRLYRLAPELDSIFSETHQPRKLDVRKLQVAIKAIYKDSLIALQSYKIRTAAFDSVLACSIINSLRAILILTSKFLLRSGEYLHTAKNNDTWEGSRGFELLNNTIDNAVSEIANTATQALGADIASYPPAQPLDVRPFNPSSLKTITGLLHIWPLYAAMTAPGVTNQQVLHFRQILLTIGEVGYLPKATALVSRPSIPRNLMDWFSYYLYCTDIYEP